MMNSRTKRRAIIFRWQWKHWWSLSRLTSRRKRRRVYLCTCCRFDSETNQYYCTARAMLMLIRTGNKPDGSYNGTFLRLIHTYIRTIAVSQALKLPMPQQYCSILCFTLRDCIVHRSVFTERPKKEHRCQVRQCADVSVEEDTCWVILQQLLLLIYNNVIRTKNLAFPPSGATYVGNQRDNSSICDYSITPLTLSFSVALNLSSHSNMLSYE